MPQVNVFVYGQNAELTARELAKLRKHTIFRRSASHTSAKTNRFASQGSITHRPLLPSYNSPAKFPP